MQWNGWENRLGNIKCLRIIRWPLTVRNSTLPCQYGSPDARVGCRYGFPLTLACTRRLTLTQPISKLLFGGTLCHFWWQTCLGKDWKTSCFNKKGNITFNGWIKPNGWKGSGTRRERERGLAHYSLKIGVEVVVSLRMTMTARSYRAINYESIFSDKPFREAQDYSCCCLLYITEKPVVQRKA